MRQRKLPPWGAFFFGKEAAAMLQAVLRRTHKVYQLYLDRQVPRAAAAMSYYLTMSLFPLIVCLYTLLGRNYQTMLQMLELADRVVSPETTRYLKGFLLYVANHPGTGMLLAAVTLLLSSASAAVRVMQLELREIRGKRSNWSWLKGWLFSMLFSLGFVAALYFGMLVMLTGPAVLAFLEKILPMLPISKSWEWLRFFVLGGLVFLTLWGVYAVSALRGGGKEATAPGALLGTLGIVLMSMAFSAFIAVSARYPLVYGSLASIILLMFWLFLSCQMICVGAALNEVLAREKEQTERQKANIEDHGKE